MAESIFTADEQYPGSGCGGGEQRSDLRIRYRRRGAIPAACYVLIVFFAYHICHLLNSYFYTSRHTFSGYFDQVVPIVLNSIGIITPIVYITEENRFLSVFRNT